MQLLASSREKQALDRFCQEEAGFPEIVLMEQAGRSCWERLCGEICSDLGLKDQALKLAVLAGPGNNGGDGLVLARHALQAGWTVQLVYAHDAWRDLPEIQRNILCSYDCPQLHWQQEREESAAALETADLIVDALFGVGLSRPLHGQYEEIISFLDSCHVPVVSIDLPSGLFQDIPSEPAVQNARPSGCVRADAVIAVRPADSILIHPFFRPYYGRLYFADAGFPPVYMQAHSSAILLEAADEQRFTLTLNPAAYKGSRGHVCMYAGSARYHGAALLAAGSAGCTAAGRVSLAVDPSIEQIIRCSTQAAVVQSSDDSPPPGTTALLVGSGWDQTGDRLSLLQRLLASGLPMVIDGDGLRLLAGLQFPASAEDAPDSRIQDHEKCRLLLTPHPGELSALIGWDIEKVLRHADEAAHNLARQWNAVVIAKSHVSIIVHPDGREYRLEGMEPSLAVAGSGDLLAGLAAGELAADADPLRAALKAALRHLAAGKILRESRGCGDADSLLEILRGCR
ncbi:NAD(P)H-hydrate epimerase [Spirochaeta dissipatitropha]